MFDSIEMNGFTVTNVREEYDKEFLNFEGTFVERTHVSLYSTTIEVEVDNKDYELEFFIDDRLMSWSSVSSKQAKGFSASILQILIRILTSDTKPTLEEFVNHIIDYCNSDWCTGMSLKVIDCETYTTLTKENVGKYYFKNEGAPNYGKLIADSILSAKN